jgi:hypothetical protein
LTCIAGIAENGTVWLAGDSAGVGGWDLTVRTDPKVFVNGQYVIGFTTSYRMGQLLRYAFSPPAPEASDVHAFMCTAFVDALRTCLKDGGYATKDSEQEKGGCFLVGVAGHLFRIDADYQIGEAADGFQAVGRGDQAARGALFATADSGMSPADRLTVAMNAAERFSAGVRLPAVMVSAAAPAAARSQRRPAREAT